MIVWKCWYRIVFLWMLIDNYFNYNGFLRIYILTFWEVVAFWVSVQNTEKFQQTHQHAIIIQKVYAKKRINFYSDCCLWNEIDFKVWILIHVVQERLDAQTERVEATNREPNSMDNTDTSDVNLKPKRCKS